MDYCTLYRHWCLGPASVDVAASGAAVYEDVAWLRGRRVPEEVGDDSEIVRELSLVPEGIRIASVAICRRPSTPMIVREIPSLT